MASTVDTDREPDIVLVILKRVRAVATLSDDQAREIEQAVRAEYGGQRFRVAKRKKHPSPEERARIFQEAISTDDTGEAFSDRNGISRRTLYNILKRG